VTANFTLYAKWTTGTPGGDIALNKTSLQMHTTDRERITATGTSNVTWTTSDKNVAVVSADGIVKATGAGTALITASAGGKTGTCTVSVEPSVIAGTGLTIWKNGEKIEIKNYNAPETINSLFVHEGDIYITGTRTDVVSGGSTFSEYSQAVVIRVECAIKDESNTLVFNDQLLETKGNASYGNDLFIASNGDIYVVGYEVATNEYNNYYRRAVMWKNGKLQPVLSDSDVGSNAAARSVFVAGNDVYAVGMNGHYADDLVWKNGKTDAEMILNRPEEDRDWNLIRGNSIFVSGSDVYVGGAAYYRPNSLARPVLWKNNVPTVLLDEFGFVYSVFVSGSDVYAASNKGLWKNSIRVLEEDLKDVCVYDGDVYATGSNGLWINGEKQPWGAGDVVIVK
jgi:hypothetical protein